MNKKRSRRIVNNRLPFVNFLFLFVFGEVLFSFLYTSFFSTFSIHGDRLFLLILTCVPASVISLILSWRIERNWLSLTSGILLPLLVYEVATMWNYSYVIRITSVACGIIAISVSFLWAWRRTGRIKHSMRRRKALVIKCASASRVILCVVLLGICIYGKILIATHNMVGSKTIEYNPSHEYEDTVDYDSSLAANISMASKVDPEGGWGTLSIDEKTEVLKTYIRIECRYFGMYDSAPSLKLAYLEEGVLGQYDYKRDVISISYNYIIDSGSSGYPVVQVLCHEMYHRYQLYQVNLLQSIRNDENAAKYAYLLFFDDAKIYEEELKTYISPGEDYYLYKDQRLEHDAEEYANASVTDYYTRIHTYLTSH